jgi:hypothetical protein
MSDILDDYLNEDNNGGDMLDDFLKEPDNYVKPKIKDPGAGQTFLEHYGDQALLHHLPQAQAFFEPVTDRIFNAVTGQNVEKTPWSRMHLGKDYVDARDNNKERLDAEKELHPHAAGAGKLTGIAADMLIGSKLGSYLAGGGGPAGGSSAANVGEKLYTAAKTGAKTGALLGAAENPGDTEGEVDPAQLYQRGKNALVGGGIGAIAGAAVDGLGQLSESGSKYFKDKAAEKAFKALGPRGLAFEKAMQSGQDQEVGRTLLDEGAIPILGTPGRIASRVDDLKEAAGQRVGELVRSVPGKTIDAEQVALDLMDHPDIAGLRKIPGMEGAADSVDKALETLASNGKMSLERAQALRQSIDKSINFEKINPTGKADVLKKIRTAIRDKMSEAIDAAGQEAPGALKVANRRYGGLAEASDILDQKMARDAANRSISLTDTIAGAGGLSAGGPGAAAVAGLANKAGRAFGNSMMARGFDKAGDVLANFPRLAAAAEKNPGAVQTLIEKLQSGVRGVGGFEQIPGLSPAIVEMLDKNPGLIDRLDPRLQKAYRKARGRSPANGSAADQKSAQQKFIEGN